MQVAVAPLRKQPPDWTAFAAETASLLLQPQPHAGAEQLPDQLRSALMDAGRGLAVAAGAHMGSPAQRCMALPEPAAARSALQGEVILFACLFSPRKCAHHHHSLTAIYAAEPADLSVHEAAAPPGVLLQKAELYGVTR